MGNERKSRIEIYSSLDRALSALHDPDAEGETFLNIGYAGRELVASNGLGAYTSDKSARAIHSWIVNQNLRMRAQNFAQIALLPEQRAIDNWVLNYMGAVNLKRSLSGDYVGVHLLPPGGAGIVKFELTKPGYALTIGAPLAMATGLLKDKSMLKRLLAMERNAVIRG